MVRRVVIEGLRGAPALSAAMASTAAFSSLFDQRLASFDVSLRPGRNSNAG